MFKLVSNTATIETATENGSATAAVHDAPAEPRICIPLLGFREPVPEHHDEHTQSADTSRTTERKDSGVAA